MGLDQTTRYIMDTTKIEIKRVANGLVLELGSHITGWETVFIAQDNDEANNIINAFIDVQRDKTISRRKMGRSSRDKAHTQQLQMEKLDNKLRKMGVKIQTNVHVHGHGSREDLRDF